MCKELFFWQGLDSRWKWGSIETLQKGAKCQLKVPLESTPDSSIYMLLKGSSATKNERALEAKKKKG